MGIFIHSWDVKRAAAALEPPRASFASASHLGVEFLAEPHPRAYQQPTWEVLTQKNPTPKWGLEVETQKIVSC